MASVSAGLARAGRRSRLVTTAVMTVAVSMTYLPVAGAVPDSAGASLEELVGLSFEQLLAIPISSTSYFPEAPLDVASTVTVIPRNDWERRGARRLPDAFGNLPGVVALPNFLGAYSTRIRGYALSDARGIVTLWDGVSINSFNLSTADNDRTDVQLDTLNSIEVIRGPGSVHYGSDAFHGVISLNAFESDRDVSRLAGRAASNGYHKASYNGASAVADNWRLNVALANSGQPAQHRTYTYTDAGSGLPATSSRAYRYQSNTAVIKLVSDPGQRMSYKFGIYYDVANQDGFQGEGGQGSVPENDVASMDSDFVMGKFASSYRLDDHQSLEFEAYRWQQTHLYERPVTSTRDIIIDADENRMAAKMIYRHDNLFGNSYFSAALGIRQDQNAYAHRRIFDATTTYVDSDMPFSGVRRTIKSLAIDTKTMPANSPWTYHYGVRIDDYDSFGEQLTPRLGAIYKLDDHSVVKALYGRAFRAPNAVELGGSPFIAGNPDLKPEMMDTVELAYLKQVRDAKLEAVLYANEWRNAISAVDTNGDGFDDAYRNLQRNDSYGLEVSYQRKLDQWLVDASGSIIRSRNKDTGTEYSAFPRYILNLGVGYDFPGGWSLYVSNRAQLDADAGPARATVIPPSLKDYWRTDVNASKTFDKHWKAYANVRNLFDRRNLLPSLVNMEGGIPDERLSVDAGFSYTF